MRILCVFKIRGALKTNLFSLKQVQFLGAGVHKQWPKGKVQPPTSFLKSIFTGTQPFSFVSPSLLAAFSMGRAQQFQQSAHGPQSLPHLLSGPWTKKSADLALGGQLALCSVSCNLGDISLCRCLETNADCCCNAVNSNTLLQHLGVHFREIQYQRGKRDYISIKFQGKFLYCFCTETDTSLANVSLKTKIIRSPLH